MRVIKLLEEGLDGRVISAEPLRGTGPFRRSPYMDEVRHYHRLRLRFPGAI